VSPVMAAVAPRLAVAHAQVLTELRRRCARVGCEKPPKSAKAKFCSDRCRHEQWVADNPQRTRVSASFGKGLVPYEPRLREHTGDRARSSPMRHAARENGAQRLADGVTIECMRCARSLLLPYVDASHTSVSITAMDGWTAPPLRCPSCSGI